MRSPVVELLGDLDGALGGLGLRWYLFGAQAAILHGAARLTADVDATVDARGVDTGRLLTALSSCGFSARSDDPPWASPPGPEFYRCSTTRQVSRVIWCWRGPGSSPSSWNASS